MINDNDIEKLLIVDEQDYSREQAKKIAMMIVKYAKISKKGDIIILDSSLSPDDKLRLSLVLRFTAHIFNKDIPETITLKELAIVLSERIEAVGSRLSILIKKENFAKKVKKGVYIVRYFMINRFLTGLENKEITYKMSKRNKNSKSNRKITNKAVTGIGKYIQDLLINNDFFKTPKTVNEVCKKLEQETKFYDPRVVDTTIRKTFVSSKKILRRLPAKDKGKSRWVYVNNK